MTNTLDKIKCSHITSFPFEGVIVCPNKHKFQILNLIRISSYTIWREEGFLHQELDTFYIGIIKITKTQLEELTNLANELFVDDK